MAATKDRTPLRQGDRATEVYHQIRDLIVQGKMAPGTRIVETEVAERLKVSRTPVRSALQRLDQEGFMLSSDDGGPTRLTVSPLTREDGNELFEIVGMLEGMAAAGAARLPEGQRKGVLQAMAAANDELREAGTKGNADRLRFFELDGAFHKACVRGGGGPRLRRLHDSVKPQAERYIRLYVSALLDQMSVSVEEHEALLEEIRAGEPERAHRAMLLNWRNAALRLDRIIESLGEQGSW